MSITSTSTTIVVSGGTQSFNDIYEAVGNPDRFFKAGSYYSTTLDFYIKTNGVVIDEGVTVEFLKETDQLVQIEKGSRLELGTYTDGVISGFSTLNAPNIKFAYGFGNTNTRNSGNLVLYGATVNVPGFWGFFEGTNLVKVIECKIKGFGRVSGSNSVLLNSPVTIAHAQYGGLSTAGEIAVSLGNHVYSSEPKVIGIYGSIACAIYHNPRFAGNLTKRNESFDKYEQLAYIESNTGADSLTLIDCDIKGNREFIRESDNITFYEKYSYNFYALETSGNRIVNMDVVITDNTGTVVSSGVTDNQGEYCSLLTVLVDTPTSGTPVGGLAVDLNPFSIHLSNDEYDIEFPMYIHKPHLDIPVVVSNSGSSDDSSGDCSISDIQTMLNTLQSNLQQAQIDSADTVTASIDDKLAVCKDSITDVIVNGPGNTHTLEEIRVRSILTTIS